MLPEGIEGGGDAPFHRVLDRHHRRIALGRRQRLNHRANALLGHQLRLGVSGEAGQAAGRTLAVGAHGSEEGETHGRGVEKANR